ncbi:hypothetical protein ACQW02_09085 [Humitalea sp. 24SJ18S-53]|uniref:hypothetical protein n=1 Tax=Humitalea sp. 24SJ18S-53 TaxID=3422307 RepID=UPI003D66CBFF
MAATRRRALAALAVASVGVAPAGAATNPDAAIIRFCAQHVTNIAAYNIDGGVLEYDDDPLWAAYVTTLDAMYAAVPQTMAGILAKAMAAKAEAKAPNGKDAPANSPAAIWAWDLVNDLLRIHGQPGGSAG